MQSDSPEDRKDKCFQEDVICGSIVLLNSNFVDNSAVLSGAAILLSDPESVLVSPMFSEGKQEGFLDIANNALLSPVNHQGQYKSWTGNRVLTKDAGGVVGTYGRSLSFSVNSSSGSRIIPEEDSRFLLTNVQSGKRIPTVQITVMDAFGQSPVPTISQSFEASVTSPETYFQGVITTSITNGIGFLANITGFGMPGEYSLEITPINNEAIDKTTLKIQVRECVVGEEPTRDRELCQECGDSAYNFDPARPNGCKPCPERAICEGRYVVPIDGYWLKGPCHATIKQCITEEACTYDQRERKLVNFSENFTDCGMSAETLSNYSELLCRRVRGLSLVKACLLNTVLSLSGL